MEQHPVPQNVTTFQFRLIGDMTLKQFGYLCAGAILAFIAYKLPLPFIITWPLAIVFAFLGIGFAFIPVEERPMDVWVFSFFKSIYSPTQYLWTKQQPATTPPPPAAPPSAVPQKPPAPPAATLPTPVPATPASPPSAPTPQGPSHIVTQTTQQSVLSGLFQQTQPTAHAPQSHAAVRPSFFEEWFGWLFPKNTPKTAVPAQTKSQPSMGALPSVTGLHPVTAEAAVSPQVTQQTEAAAQEKIQQMEENLSKLEARLSQKTATDDRVLELQKQLTEIMSAKSKSEEELTTIKRQLLNQKSEPPKTVIPQQQGSVNVITTQEQAIKAGLPRLTNTPNVITGIVRDDGGNLLPGILVTVANTEGIPMRALKTNKLGQFGASTPLASGTYIVEVEDPRSRFTFSRVQITLTGAVVPVLEIIAKSEKMLTRERLTQEIFGKPTS